MEIQIAECLRKRVASWASVWGSASFSVTVLAPTKFNVSLLFSLCLRVRALGSRVQVLSNFMLYCALFLLFPE